MWDLAPPPHATPLQKILCIVYNVTLLQYFDIKKTKEKKKEKEKEKNSMEPISLQFLLQSQHFS